MVFCNTLNSSRAVDHFLTENQISTVNYHGEVPAEERFFVFLILFCYLSRWLHFYEI
jgi:superfamily II DNA helicase RecQ